MPYTGEFESKDYPGFYHVPSLENTLINTAGQVIDIEKQWCPLPDINPDGYPCVNSNNNRRFIHRLLALTFLPLPDLPVSNLDVNHIDGVKDNNDIENLEWSTRSENSLHAYRTGLRSDNVPVLVKDLRDGTIVRHYSLHECGRFFNVHAAAIHRKLGCPTAAKPYRRFYVLIREGQPWPATDQNDIVSYANGVARPIVARSAQCLPIIFESIGKAAEYFGHKPKTLTMHILRHKNREFHDWSFSFLDDSVPGSELDESLAKSYLPETVS